MKNKYLEGLFNKIAGFAQVRQDEALLIVNDIYSEGVNTRSEADLFFDLSESLREEDQAWNEHFIKVIRDYLLNIESPQGRLCSEECDWLKARIHIGKNGIHPAHMDLLLDIMRHAQKAPADFGLYILESACELAVNRDYIRHRDIERIRLALSLTAHSENAWIGRDEATILFNMNDQMRQKYTFISDTERASWDTLFTLAITNHLVSETSHKAKRAPEALQRKFWLSEDTDDEGRSFGEAILDMIGRECLQDVLSVLESAASASRTSHSSQTGTPSLQGMTSAELSLINFLKQDKTPVSSALTIAA